MPSPNTNVGPFWLALYVILISVIPNFVLCLDDDPQIVEAGHGCSLISTTNLTALTENRKNVFSLLAKNMSSTGFAVASSGNGTDKVYGLAQCRNDLSMEDCTQCYTAATEQIVKYCPIEIGVRMIFDGCFLRYENETFFDQAVDGGNSNVCLSDASGSSPTLFNETALRLLADVKSKALKKEGFATDEISAKGLPTTIYGLAMCRRTLSTNSCDVCLQHASKLVQRCFSRQDGRALDAGCYLRYYPSFFLHSLFFLFTKLLDFVTNSFSTAKHRKTLLIVVGTLGGVALVALLLVLLIFRNTLRNMYRKVPGRSQREEAGEEMPFSHKLMNSKKFFFSCVYKTPLQ
ncbi:hypothetical protein SUGI_0678650 [Cryptomeria japonica]|nr:hypothetical protein SUGI_0678650 [Cryptomeria japonica]